jgi:hypothetical protein
MAKRQRNPERSFGVSVGGVLVAIAAVLLWRGRVGRAEVIGGIGVVLLVLGLVSPRLLKTPNAVWMRFAQALGYVNARILLTILFSLVLIPVAFLWRMIGKDPLVRRRDRFAGWSPYPVRYRDHAHFERMF